MLFCADRHNFSDFVGVFQKCQVTNKTGAAGSSALQYPQSWFAFSSWFWLIIEKQHKRMYIHIFKHFSEKILPLSVKGPSLPKDQLTLKTVSPEPHESRKLSWSTSPLASERIPPKTNQLSKSTNIIWAHTYKANFEMGRVEHRSKFKDVDGLHGTCIETSVGRLDIVVD